MAALIGLFKSRKVTHADATKQIPKSGDSEEKLRESMGLLEGVRKVDQGGLQICHYIFAAKPELNPDKTSTAFGNDILRSAHFVIENADGEVQFSSSLIVKSTIKRFYL
ncbi:hypothetical protein ACH42_05625 [Endozoicomonas sp. (ex Bugula neritina AB1)]|nr:hypothetical protein ACH42_05625 [Endozoicomonas sp. (ex Bugula neritina AB1)]